MTPAELRRRMGAVVFEVELLENELGRSDAGSAMKVAASDLSVALDYLRAVHDLAGKMLVKSLRPDAAVVKKFAQPTDAEVAQLTDADRAQADDAAGRA